MTTATLTETDFKVADLSLAEFGRKEIRLAEHEMPGLMATREEFADAQPLKGARDRRLAAHDGADGRADRDPRRARRRGAVGQLQHLLHAGPRRRRRRRRPDGTPEEPQGVPVFAWKGETLEEYWWCTEQALTWPDGGPNMILDDGGDATMLVHKGVEFEKAGAVPEPAGADSEECRVILALLQRSPRTIRRSGRDRGRHQGRDRGDHDRRPPPLRDDGGGHAALPRHQRQRLGHQVEVRQQVRLPPLADRRPQPRHRRPDRRQGRRGLRVRRRGQGLRRVAARPGRARDRHRDRPDLRAAGRDGRLPGADAGGRPRDGRHLRHRDRATRTSSRPPTWPG